MPAAVCLYGTQHNEAHAGNRRNCTPWHQLGDRCLARSLRVASTCVSGGINVRMVNEWDWGESKKARLLGLVWKSEGDDSCWKEAKAEEASFVLCQSEVLISLSWNITLYFNSTWSHYLLLSESLLSLWKYSNIGLHTTHIFMTELSPMRITQYQKTFWVYLVVVHLMGA